MLKIWKPIVVTCRIGSLEMYEYDKTEESSVTCRIGSLETAGGRKNYIRDGYLPNRQLRNVRCRITPPAKSYLPNRQLRNPMTVSL